jgi:hypothetical protein
MITLAKAPEIAFSNDIDFETEHTDAALADLSVQFDGTWSGGAGTLAQDDVLKVLGRLEFNHNGPRIAADARLLYWNSVWHDRGVRGNINSGAGATGSFRRNFGIPLHRMCPRGGIDAVARVAAWKGRFRNGTAMLSGGATIAVGSRFRASAKRARTAPQGGFRDPEIKQETIKCENSSVSANGRRIEFKSDMILPYLILMPLDADGDTALLTDRSLRTDGLVQRVTIDRYGIGGEVLRLVDDVTWGYLRQQTGELGQWSSDDMVASAGIVVIPLIDPSEKDGLLRMPSGSHLSITLDTASTVEGSYTDVTPAAGDTCEVLVPSFFANELATPRRAPTLAEASARARQGSGRTF